MDRLPLRFEWDPGKAASNHAKHAVSFEEARSVFSDPDGLLIPDPDHSGDEDRFILLGRSESGKPLVVVHCFRAEYQVIRLISARPASRRERSNLPSP